MRSRLAVALCGVAALVSTSDASASSLMIAPPGVPAEGAPFTVNLSGDTAGFTDDAGRLRVSGRPAGGAACAPTFFDDPGTSIVSGEDVSGAWTHPATVTVPDAGEHLICAWLEDDGVTQRAAQVVVTVRLPSLSLVLTAPTKRITPGKPLTVTATWTAEVARDLHVALVQAPNCAQSYAAVQTLASNYTTALDRRVSGTGQQSYVATLSTPGTYLLCGYLEKAADQPAQLVAKAPHPVRVAAPPRAKRCRNAGGRRHIARVRAWVLSCASARSVARRWGAKRPSPKRVAGLRCRAKAGRVKCTGTSERKITFRYRR